MKDFKNKQKKLSIVIIGLVFVLIAAAVILLRPGNTGKEMSQLDPTVVTTAAVEAEIETAPSAPTDPVLIVELENGRIHTPYGDLNFPEELSDHLLIVNTCHQPYTLAFYAVMEGKYEVRMFDISLGEGSGGNMGKVTTPDGEVPLNITIYSLTGDETWTDGEFITVQAMQDVVNEMIEQMAPKTDSVQSEAPVFVEQPAEVDTVHNMKIVTPYCTMYYPARWNSTMYYEHDDSQEDIYKVHVYGRVSETESQLLFSIYFGGDEGDQLGAVMNSEGIPVPVNLLLNQLELDGLNEEDAELLCAMQEASNELVEKLPLLP